MLEIPIAALEEKRAQIVEKCNCDLAEIDAAIAQVRAMNPNGNGELLKVGIPVRLGQYKGMKLAPALDAYVRERGGGPIDIDQAIKDLEMGGAPLGQTKERYKRNVRITISNSRTLRYGDRGKRTVELADRMRSGTT